MQRAALKISGTFFCDSENVPHIFLLGGSLTEGPCIHGQGAKVTEVRVGILLGLVTVHVTWQLQQSGDESSHPHLSRGMGCGCAKHASGNKGTHSI